MAYFGDIENRWTIDRLGFMNHLDRVDLLEKIGVELQGRMTTTDINCFLSGFGVANANLSMATSKRTYVKDLLAIAEDNILTQIADELGIKTPVEGSLGSKELMGLLNGNAYVIVKKDFEDALHDLDSRPDNAIGMASTTLESLCKEILDSLNLPYPHDESLQPLIKTVYDNMNLSPDGYADPELKRILGGLFNAGAGIASLRTKYSSFHGKGKKQYRLGKRHARLAINCLTTIGLFLIETYQERFQ